MRTRTIRTSRAWLAAALALSAGLSLSPSKLWECRAAQISSTIDGSLTKQEYESIMQPLIASYKATRSTGESFLDWISSQRSEESKSSGTSARSESTSAAAIETQTLIPSDITNEITNSKFVQDLEHLFDVKSGKLVNWNQQSLDALASDLGIHTPKDATATSQADSSKSKLEAQVINGSAGGGTSQPAPVPEPSTLVFSGLVAGALAIRQNRRKRVVHR